MQALAVGIDDSGVGQLGYGGLQWVRVGMGHGRWKLEGRSKYGRHRALGEW